MTEQIVNDSSPDLKVTPLEDVIPVTPSTTVDLPDGPCRCLLADADGTVDLITLNGSTRAGVLVFKGYNPVGARRVKAATVGIQAGY